MKTKEGFINDKGLYLSPYGNESIESLLKNEPYIYMKNLTSWIKDIRGAFKWYYENKGSVRCIYLSPPDFEKIR